MDDDRFFWVEEYNGVGFTIPECTPKRVLITGWCTLLKVETFNNND